MAKKKPMDSYTATSIFEGWGEGESATEEERIEAGQFLIDTGLGWGLQGSTGRALQSGIDAGVLHYPKKHTAQSSHDYYGNKIPTHAEAKKHGIYSARKKKLKQQMAIQKAFDVDDETQVWVN